KGVGGDRTVVTGGFHRPGFIGVEGRGDGGVDELRVDELFDRDAVHGADVTATDEPDADHGCGAAFGSTRVAGRTARLPKRSRTTSTARSTAARRSTRWFATLTSSPIASIDCSTSAVSHSLEHEIPSSRIPRATSK